MPRQWSPTSLQTAQRAGIIGSGKEVCNGRERRAAKPGRPRSELDRLTREGYKAAVDQAFEAQKSGMRLSRRFFENWVETLDDHAELNRRTLGSLQELVREQREVFRSSPGSPSTPTTAFWIRWTPIRKRSRNWKSARIERGSSGRLEGGPVLVYIERVDLVDGSYYHRFMREEELPESLSEGRRSGGFDGVNPLATDVLRRNGLKSWTKPAPSLYPHQWSWDSAFIALGLAHVDNRRATDELETLFTGQWSTGKVPHIVFDPEAPPKSYFPDAERWNSSALSEDAPSGPRTSGLCQPPVHAIAVRRIWQTSRGKDEERVDRARAFLQRQLPAPVLLAPLPGDRPRPRRLGARDHLPSLGERHGQLPALGRRPGEDLRRGGAFLHPLRPPARLRPLAPADRQRVRPLSVAAGAAQAGPLRRGRHLRATPVPRQGRPLFRHPRCGQRGVVGDLRGRRGAATRTGRS